MSLKNKVIVRLEKKVLVKVPECSDEKTEMTESIPYSFRKNFFFCNFASNLWREDILTLLYCFVKQILLNIEMKKIFTFAALLCATWMNAQQIGGDFDNFETGYNTVGVQPVGWKGSNVNQTVKVEILPGFGFDQSATKELIFQEEGRNAQCVKLVNTFVGVSNIGSNAPAYISLGTPWVYATSKVSEADGGTCGGKNFNFRPDALKGYLKRSLGSEKPTEQGQILVYSWKGKTELSRLVSVVGNGTPQTQTLVDREKDVLGIDNSATKSPDFSLISKASYMIPAQSLNDWTEVLVPIEYFNDEIPEKINVIISSADYFNRGNIGNGNTLWADDFEFVYYSELASLNYDGQDYFQKGNTNYTIDALYDESKLTCTSNGRGATIEKSYYDEASAVLTITVKGNDFSVNPSNVHTYKVQFAKPQPVITEYENDLLVALNNQGMPSQLAKIQLIKEIDGTTSLALNNFVLGNAVPVGNIKLTNLEIKDGKIQATQDIRITAGDDPAYGEEEWIGPGISAEQPVPVKLDATILADNKMEAVIDIPLAPGFMEVKVTFAETQTYTDGQALSLNTGLTNIAYNRTFPEGWSTVCLPFATPAVAFGDNATSVQEFVSADESGLNFAEVETLEANKPYLIYFAAAKETPTYFGTEITSTTPVSVTKGDYTFVGSYDAVMSMSGKYGIATVDDVQKIILGGANSTLKATRAYFTKKGEQPAQVRINLFGMGGDGDGTTGIDQIVNGGAQTYDVYTLQGVQVLKGAASLDGLQKGIYIVNGKKVVIK